MNTDEKTPSSPHPSPPNTPSDGHKMALFLTEIKDLRKQLDELKNEKKEPIEVRMLRLEGEMAVLRNLLTDETPGGKTRLNALGKAAKTRHPFYVGR